MRILSLDGGGIRGIIPGKVLVAFEQKLQAISGRPDMRVVDAFDLIAGTSTGGILTCLYLCPDKESGRPKFSAQEAVDLYLNHGDSIFDITRFKHFEFLQGWTDAKYSATVLETLLKEYLGDLMLSDLLKPSLITSYDISRRRAMFFNSADVARKGNGWNFYLRDVARATSAAPTYFEPVNISSIDQNSYPLVDGGVFANNPAMCACIEAFNLNPSLNVTDLQVFSLGTGAADKSYSYDEAKDWGKISWVVPFVDIMMSGVSETVDFQLQQLFNSAGCSSQYLRLQLDLKDFPDVSSEMDHASKSNMMELEKAGDALAQESDAKLATFAKMLLGVGD